VTLSNYIQILWRRKWIIIVTVLVTVGAAVARTAMITPTYTASTTVRVETPRIGSLEFFQYDLTFTDRLMNTYAIIATSGPVMDELAERLELEQAPTVNVEIVQGTELLNITVTDEDSEVAMRAANELYEILRVYLSVETLTREQILREQLDNAQEALTTARENFDALASQYPPDDERVVTAGRLVTLRQEDLDRYIEEYSTYVESIEDAAGPENTEDEIVENSTITQIEPATEPESPSSPNRLLNIGLGLLIGMVGGLSLSILVESLDTKLYTSPQIEAVTDVSVLGRIPSNRGKRLVATNGRSSQELEAYRILRTNILLLNDEHPPQTLVVTSPTVGEGKSTTVANLATAIAQSGRRVVVVDSDLRNPAQHKIYSKSNEAGLVDVLQGELPVDDVIQETDFSGLHLIPSGKTPADPLELLASHEMSNIIDTLSKEFDVVLLDSPDLETVTDAAVLGSITDGVLLVVGRAKVKQDRVQKAYQKLNEVNANLIGVTINWAEKTF
jgi:capsular exopolysaccharide synthesis family protein